MRLPLRHPPLGHDAPARRCKYLEMLAEAAIGLPLAAAAEHVAARSSRGRYGSALQWHLGLEPHDAQSEPDWEQCIEIKLVSVWATGAGHVRCDKLKVCDTSIDPWHKLANVLWVFVDRLTRVVVGATFSRLAGEGRRVLEASWHEDPHFGAPALFVEAREQAGKMAPAYYISAQWFAQAGLLPEPAPWIFAFDHRWWGACRADFARDPLLTVVDGHSVKVTCRRCGGPLQFEPEVLQRCGWSPARHGLPWGERCARAGHFVVLADRLLVGQCGTPDELLEALEARAAADGVWRLADRILEPEDHGHSAMNNV